MKGIRKKRMTSKKWRDDVEGDLNIAEINKGQTMTDGEILF
jgi:hypothetical protein